MASKNNIKNHIPKSDFNKDNKEHLEMSIMTIKNKSINPETIRFVDHVLNLKKMETIKRINRTTLLRGSILWINELYGVYLPKTKLFIIFYLTYL